MAAADAVLTRLEESTRDALRLQLETLRAILERNAGVGYLRPFLSDGRFPDPARADPASVAAAFRALVPLSSYADYADLIERIADGTEQPTALSVDPLICFFNSSGTSTSKQKLIPFFDPTHYSSASRLAHQSSSALIQRIFPPKGSARVLWFLYAGNVTTTRAGFEVMAASAYPFHAKSPTPSPLLSMCISPREVITGSDATQQMYCHLLCGLRHSASIDCIRAPYAAGLIRAMRMLESKWTQLCNDIESGLVSPEITELPMRAAVEELLGGPQPHLVTRIRDVCSRNNWSGILPLLWPEVRYLSCVGTGSMEQYYPTLKHYAGENLPLLGGDYFASECAVGVNMDRTHPPELTSYVIVPTAAYFEFLPFDIGTSPEVAEETVDISGVEAGKMYEVVVTTYRGLYRYRLNDVVKVVGFHNSSPKVEFITRAPKEASEVFTERDLISAMATFELMIGDGDGGQVVEFACCIDPDGDRRHAIIFVELNKDCKFLQMEMMELIAHLKRCSQSLEGCLGSAYEVKRATSGDLAPLQIWIVKPGSFDGLASVAMENGAPANQYKPAKIIRNSKFVDFLKVNVIINSEELDTNV